ncbi:hypothetical protein ASF48_17315 [Rathayibacter sp. Leaf299]|uniref:YkgJ family cysteine cluster protein n=1 Tax=Rathayibacter sp. Leaf299 TaxID=1736328 RepID=UPI0006F8ED25|nr:hypothetical protein [Rathayibacter sp. Leaf299]KQQ18681.1 hypothetical protein ASF48_17315 [Rathayibacter sp. Leaf299]
MRSRTARTAEERALERLEDLYAELPTLSCLGLCEKSCHQHIDASALERRRLLAKGVDLDAPTPDGACPALSRTFGAGRCSVHAIRPTICRLWGVSAAMPCEHGCVPDGGRVSDAQAMRWMLTSYDIGGHADTSPDVRALLEQCLADEHASALLSRYLRGDRSITAQLRDRILQLRVGPPHPS